MLKEGIVIKDYTLKKFLGRGAFGEVWLAEKKIEIADKTVPFALKFLPANVEGISDNSSVRREMNTWIGASGNKNVVSVLDGFLHENYFVIVSEYADGGSLRDWLKENGGKAPTLEKAVEIMSGILDGLSHLHKQNIVHRDLKPENVLLKDDIPCIADFGVSRIIENTSLTNSQLGTNTAGSPMYMSPESFERIKPAPQIDIWSAGVMLFEMLSGKTPYSGETIPALIFEIVTKEPRDLPANIPDSFQRVVKKSLAKELDDRFSSAKEMREALMKALYTQDFIPTASDEDFVTTQRQGNNSAVAANSAATVVMASKPSTNTGKPGGSKKALAWAGIGATGLLAASLGIFTMSQMTKDNPKQNNNSVANQTVNSTVNPTNSVNSADTENTVSNTKPETTSTQIAPKSGDIQKVEKQNTQSQSSTKTKSESASKKETSTQPSKKKGTPSLDDLTDRNHK